MPQDGKDGRPSGDAWTVEVEASPEQLDWARLGRLFGRAVLERLVEQRLVQSGWEGPDSPDTVTMDPSSQSVNPPS